MRVACISGLPGTWVPQVHANCSHNENAALLLRSLASLPRPVDCPVGGGFERLFRQLRSIARRYSGQSWSHLETARSYSGMLGRRYAEAERSLRLDGRLRSSDYKLRAFLKAEKVGAAKDAKPRMIFPRSPRYNLSLASWLKPFEHWLWGYLTFSRLFGGRNLTRIVAKGLSPTRRANLIKRKLERFDCGACFEVDGKAFEAHVSSPQIRAEHGVYLAAFRGSPGLHSVLSHQTFEGVTSSGQKFSRPGGRASGDFNTGMGNSLIMLAVVGAVLLSRGVTFDLLVDGDNALVFCELADLDCVRKDFARDVLAESGHELALEAPTVQLESIRFGRSAPLCLGGDRWTMVREPWSVLSGATASHRWLREPAFARRYLEGVARCELSLAVGVPVIQAWALRLLRACGTHRKALPSAALADYFVVGARLVDESCVVEPSREARLSFERAFGISPDEQLQWEATPVVYGQCPAGAEPGVWPSCALEARPGLFEPWLDARVSEEEG